jgi:glycogen synthase
MNPAPKRVLMTADTVGGVWTFSIELCRLLIKQNFSVALATMGRSIQPDQRAALNDLPQLEVFESEFRLEWMENPWPEVAAAGEWLLGIAESWSPDLVHINGYTHANLRWRRPVVLVAHSCVASWYQAVRGVSMPAEWDHYKASVKAGLKAADIVVAPSRAMLDNLTRNYGPIQNGTVIQNGLRSDLAGTPIGGKEPFIFAAGRLWDEAKNVSALAGIAGELLWPVIVAGDDALETGGATSQELRRLGRLSPEEVRVWMGRAAVYALPAKYEPFGLSILEAAQAGCALVLGDIPSLREIWGDAAIFVDPADRRALRDVLNGLAKQPELVAQWGTRARSAAELYSPERMLDSYLDVYAEAAVAYSARIDPRLLAATHINDGPVPIKREGTPCEY